MLSESFLRDFFHLRPGKKSKDIDQTCSKCGNDMNMMEYDHVFKRINIRCSRCKYSWSVPTLDSQAKPDAEPK